ncbi:MAG: hypothetical protein RIR70_744 [Pseudomonadota bacterium]
MPVRGGGVVVHGRDDNEPLLELGLPDEAATLALGAALGGAVVAGLFIYLEGDLGAGKTTLVRGMLRGCGYDGKVKSPTYTIVELYPILPLNFYHFDFYRLNQPEEVLDAGLDECFRGDAVCLFEWPDKALPHIPAADLVIELALAPVGRCARVRAIGARGEVCLKNLITNLPAGLVPNRAAGS